MYDNLNFRWKRYPEAWQWFGRQLEKFVRANPDICDLDRELSGNAGMRLIDFIDYLVLEDTRNNADLLTDYGFSRNGNLFEHPGAILPRVKLSRPIQMLLPGVAVRVESLVDFLALNRLGLDIHGSPFGAVRHSLVSVHNKTAFWVVERRLDAAYEPRSTGDGYLDRYFSVLEKWNTRPRCPESGNCDLGSLIELAEKQVEKIGPDMAAYLFLEAERNYWQKRNRAAGVIKHRLDALGVGWAGCDHHTFRSSRQNFSLLVKFFQLLGFKTREKFYAGIEAGWGAQVMENLDIRATLFLDVDLAPGEIDLDFSQENLPPTDGLGTVGLWCSLHGDSIMDAGLHHLAILADFEKLKSVLAEDGVETMAPFSTLPHLRQAFTVGERRPVPRKRLERMLADGILDGETAARFGTEGAVGSHLENIERKEGYKGFSRREVSHIIKETDPRTYRFA